MTKPETRLRNRIKAALQGAGCFVTVIHGSIYQEAGLPDLCCVYRGRSLWIEVKRPGESSRPAQTVMKARLWKAQAVAEVATSVEEALAVLAALQFRIDREAA
jgi:hypothetical protein